MKRIRPPYFLYKKKNVRFGGYPKLILSAGLEIRPPKLN